MSTQRVHRGTGIGLLLHALANDCRHAATGGLRLLLEPLQGSLGKLDGYALHRHAAMVIQICQDGNTEYPGVLPDFGGVHDRGRPALPALRVAERAKHENPERQVKAAMLLRIAAWRGEPVRGQERDDCQAQESYLHE